MTWSGSIGPELAHHTPLFHDCQSDLQDRPVVNGVFVKTISENYYRHKGSLCDVCDDLFAMKFDRGVSVVIINSIEDHTFRTIEM